MRQFSATGVPSSPYFRMNAFCASVEFDASMRFKGAEHGQQNPLFSRAVGSLGSGLGLPLQIEA